MMRGVYVLIISVSEATRLNVGALGGVNFEKGLYAYIGSAQNNLEKRIRRHLGKTKRKFWHIDYLLGNRFVKVVGVFYKEAGKPEECRTAKKVADWGVSIVDFGCSDCNCVSHLFMLKDSGYSRSSKAFLTANFTRSVHA